MDLSNWQAANLLQLLLSSQALLLSLYLLTQGRGRFLGAFLLALAMHMLMNLSLETGMFAIPDITHAMGYLYAPLLYLFSREMAFAETRLNVASLKHLGYFLVAIPLPMLIDNASPVLGFGIILVTYGYLIRALLDLRRFEHALKKTHSVTPDISLTWLKRFILSLLIIASIDFLRLILIGTAGYDAFYLIVIGLLFIYLMYISLQVLKRPDFFVGITPEELSVAEASEVNAALEEDLDSLSEQIKAEQLYLNPKLSLSELAEVTGYSPRDLSALINNGAEQNFSDFINGFRIEHACELMAEQGTKRRTLLDILLSSGFNSKSAFNASFKKLRGQTPSEFKNQLKKTS